MTTQKVVISADIRMDLEQFLSSLKYDKLFVLTDTNTQEKCFPLLQNIPQVKQARLITIKAGDLHKELDQVVYIWNILSNEGASRNSLLINIGGGMITDLGGFAGATFKRGLQTVNIPTTLMASVDASVGGKTGINFNGLKNEIGSFYPPLCVFIDCAFLQSLDKDNILSGYAEMIKHALISSEEMYNAILGFDLNIQCSTFKTQLTKLVADSVAVKERIVEEDPKEQGIRKALNFGHTVGHAIESLSFKQNQPLLHGHAVAVGMICELYLSYKQCGFPSKKLSQITHYIKEYYPPFFFNCTDYNSLYAFMTHDKKNEAGIINFTLLVDIGKVRINQSVSKEVIMDSLDFYRESFGI
ncbi:3-dehydroquinate synthase [Parabacteroides sp. PF5-5]|uniref:3-dehydroquinate synthase n=1 Tax=unclassified Parabacteroides TaxID=2649774 RepID=UPI0024744186|nr:MULTISPECIES: 3-dehydroquinate synthase [unclassified Parabacteroides]MDH6306420.1 3-dehydroquinate synthase [Parabacteroides sp. PH5-39]MDH6317428.1 3-dehydroquinate synthase [Parabacteroides sp. PF5-13]MDH6321131.1 3-dehydroquinate synthase [Parabacteroides sp. PH5-13]MDH6324863.1 3-dehydroquinate synthase [Parabacteroides sp. PH5-8]MDH6328613.1 3-dehydroquinate synthase [Parabacteroides sp. PH5-41]